MLRTQCSAPGRLTCIYEDQDDRESDDTPFAIPGCVESANLPRISVTTWQAWRTAQTYHENVAYQSLRDIDEQLCEFVNINEVA